MTIGPLASLDNSGGFLRLRLRLFCLVGLILWFPSGTFASEPYSLHVPLGLDEDLVQIPVDNPLTKSKVELGRLLFFDKRLSQDSTVACSSCHIPTFTFSDGLSTPTGISGQKGDRHTPTVINRIFSSAQFWDGRAATLEAQSVAPFINSREHGLPSYPALVAKVEQISGYQALFQQTFGAPPSVKTIGQALASFQRTILSGNSPFDQAEVGESPEALSPAARRGLGIFKGKGGCIDCHLGFTWTDELFHNLGIDWDTHRIDLGRYHISNDPKDIGAFKTPTLREVSRTAPYMHDGRFTTLRQVIEFYNKGGIPNPFLDQAMKPLHLTTEEMQDLEELLLSLNGEGWQVEEPTEFPQ